MAITRIAKRTREVVNDVAFMLSRLTTLDTVWMYLVILTLEIIKLVVGFIILKSGIWCKKFVADGTLRVGDAADGLETSTSVGNGSSNSVGDGSSNGNNDGASEQSKAQKSPEAWLVENLEGEPTTVVEPESDFLDDPKPLI